jgi:hypothetical protein
MTAQVSFGLIDKSLENSRCSLNLPALTGVNYDDVTGNAVGNNVGDLRIAIAAITLCNLTGTTVQAVQYPENPIPPASAYAQREIGLRVFYADSVTGDKYNFTIPGPDLTLLAQEGTDLIDTSNALWIALVAAVEANAVSPAGNPVEVLQGRIVGRSN